MRAGYTHMLLLPGNRGRWRRLLEAVRATELLAEFLDATGGVDELLLASEERMAGAADIDADAGRRAAGLECVAAGTADFTILVFRMNFSFHGRTPFSAGRAFRNKLHVSRPIMPAIRRAEHSSTLPPDYHSPASMPSHASPASQHIWLAAAATRRMPSPGGDG
jgi:hypothetical protein